MAITARMNLIEFKNLRFVLTGQPNLFNISSYVNELVQYNTRMIVKVSESNYNLSLFHAKGIQVRELIYPDGSFPSNSIIDEWITIIKNYFRNYPESSLAVHCHSGLGRSAVLVAIALMECGFDKAKVVETIRSQRRGSFNDNQVAKIVEYSPKYRLTHMAY